MRNSHSAKTMNTENHAENVDKSFDVRRQQILIRVRLPHTFQPPPLPMIFRYLMGARKISTFNGLEWKAYAGAAARPSKCKRKARNGILYAFCTRRSTPFALLPEM